MAFSLVNNISALNSQARLSATSNHLNQTIQRLSSGLRITNSGDDAAGLAIANKYRSDVAELNQGIRNANDGLSSLQIADGGLNTISGLLDRALTLATQAASDTFSGDRTVLSDELTAVTTEITRQADNIGMSASANTNADKFTAAALTIFIGGGSASNSDNNTVSINLTGKEVDATTLGIDSLDVSSTADARDAVDAIKSAVTTLGASQAAVGAGENNLSQAIDLAMSQVTNFSSAESRIRDADMSAEASNMARLSVLQQAGVAALAQANQSSQAVLSLLR